MKDFSRWPPRDVGDSVLYRNLSNIARNVPDQDSSTASLKVPVLGYKFRFALDPIAIDVSTNGFQLLQTGMSLSPLHSLP